MRRGDGWHDERNADLYAAFAERYPMYRQASAHLVDMAAIAPGSTAVDLACGTGAGVARLLDTVGPDGRVIGVDSSPAMLARAMHRLRAENLTWIHASAEDLDTALTEEADAVVCNAALWQTRLPAALAAVTRALRPGGVFAFNMPDRRPPAGPPPGSFMAAVHAEAVAAGWRPPEEARNRQVPPGGMPLPRLLGAAGLQVVCEETFTQAADPMELRAWLSIPIFAASRLPGLSADAVAGVLDRALAACDTSIRSQRRWDCFLCRRTAAIS